MFPANKQNNQQPQNSGKVFYFSLKQFALVVKVLRGNIENKLNKFVTEMEL